MTGLSAEQVAEFRRWIKVAPMIGGSETRQILSKLDEMTRPKPVECWRIYTDKGEPINDIDYASKEIAESYFVHRKEDCRIVHLREVL